MSSAAVRVVVMSDRRLVRDAITGYLANWPEFAAVGHTPTLDSLAELCLLRRPDAALIDTLALTVESIDSLIRLRKVAPSTAIIVTYLEASVPALRAAAQAGITALVPCSRGLDEVLRVVRDQVHGAGPRQPDGVALTDYDLRVVSLLSQGHSVPEMAELLRISPRTVENHKRRLYGKLGVSSGGEAVSRTMSLGLVEVGPEGGPHRRDEPGRAPLVVVVGDGGRTRDRVQRSVTATGLSVVTTAPLAALGHQHWARWHRGPLVVVLVDPESAAWQASSSLRARVVVVRTAEPQPTEVVDLVLHGAFALLRDHDVEQDLAFVLSAVARGYLTMDRAMMDGLTGWMRVGGHARPPALTSRDADILAALADGRTIRQTGALLGITAKSVENAQARLYRKLGARNRAEALALAHGWGLLGPTSNGRFH